MLCLRLLSFNHFMILSTTRYSLIFDQYSVHGLNRGRWLCSIVYIYIYIYIEALFKSLSRSRKSLSSLIHRYTSPKRHTMLKIMKCGAVSLQQLRCLFVWRLSTDFKWLEGANTSSRCNVSKKNIDWYVTDIYGAGINTLYRDVRPSQCWCTVTAGAIELAGACTWPPISDSGGTGHNTNLLLNTP